MLLVLGSARQFAYELPLPVCAGLFKRRALADERLVVVRMCGGAHLWPMDLLSFAQGLVFGRVWCKARKDLGVRCTGTLSF